ncbi:MAG TPA: LUD domain-containing protein [Pyrinomonadaceae bacterium]|nr:LUD domain-containing protein [Pyrinomonadaceae bacterium]
MTAREEIMQSIRANLAASAGLPVHHAGAPANTAAIPGDEHHDRTPVARFRERLESVGGHCFIVSRAEDASRVLEEILTSLNSARRIALSDAPLVAELMSGIEKDEINVCPAAADLFAYDVGITSAQAAIAETGTVILQAENERHRLISLLPPVHIAIVRAGDIQPTIGAALAALQHQDDLSRAITFITGPSRTADIELTLTVGVHGPKELYVIIIDG